MAENEALRVEFMDALKRAQNNITEKEEPAALELMNAGFSNSFLGEKTAQQNTVSAIFLLGKINGEAMIEADHRLRQFGHAVTWGIVFKAVSVFFAGMLFKRNLSRILVKTLEEIHAVMSTHRRCITEVNVILN